MLTFFVTVGVCACMLAVIVMFVALVEQINHWRFMRRIERQKKQCPNCGGTGKVQS